MPLSAGAPPPQPGSRKTVAILAGMLVLLAVAVGAWLSTPMWGARASSTAVGVSPTAVVSPSSAPSPATPVNRAGRMKVEVVASYPHDIGAFTRGLVFDGGVLYGSTGLAGQSTLRRVDLETGRVLQKVALAREFGEGIARVPAGVLQLTWKNQV